jgi:flagellar hook-length control protein FliK
LGLTSIEPLTNSPTSDAVPGESADNDVNSLALSPAVETGNLRTANKSLSAIDSETSESHPDAVVVDSLTKPRLAVTRRTSEQGSNSPAPTVADSSPVQTQENMQISQSPTSTPVVGQATTSASAAHQVGSTAPTSGQPEVNPIEFVDRVTNSIRLVQQDGQQLRIRLNPPHLGPLHIEVTSRGGALSVRLEVQTASAHHALVENMPMLRNALVQSGMSLDRIDVQLIDPAGDDAQPRFTDDTEQQQTEQQSQQDPQQDPPEESDEQGDDDVPNPTYTGIDELDIQV